MRLIDADILENELSDSVSDNSTAIHILNEAPTVQAIPIDVLDKIRAEIEKDMLYYADVRNKDSEKWCVAKRSGLNRALEIIDSTVRKALK